MIVTRKKFMAIAAILFGTMLLGWVLSAERATTVSTEFLEWDNQKYLMLRDGEVDNHKKQLIDSGARLINAPSDMPTFLEVGQLYVVMFAGVSLAQFHTFATVKSDKGQCVETPAIGNYVSVVCQFSLALNPKNHN